MFLFTNFKKLVVIVAFVLIAVNAKVSQIDRLYAMSISELLQVEVTQTAGALTETSRAKAPAAVTRIYQSDIQILGARSLMELLEITVPSLQVIRHHWELPHLGLRGVTSDQEDKVMIRVNGRVMNQRAVNGAITERDFPLMKDIKYIDIIRGAGSSMYGLGAVSMVIDITTFDAFSLKENSFTARGGAGMPYYAIGGNYGKQFNKDMGIYLHAEFADIKGANCDNAPLFFGADGVSIETGDTILKGEAFSTISRDGEGYEGKPFIKGHVGFDYKKTKFWLRYTEAGRNEVTTFQQLTKPPTGFGRTEEDMLKVGYKQFTSLLEQKYDPSEAFGIKWMVSFDKTAVVKKRPLVKPRIDEYDEAELFTKVVAKWHATEKVDMALGSEYSYENFGLIDTDEDFWNSNTLSFFGEWQWRPVKSLTTYLGGRVDKNKYSDALFSPRTSMVYSSDEINFYKLLYTKSQRMNGALDSRKAELNENDISKPEVLNSIEMRYERVAEKIFIGISSYYIDLSVIGWDNNLHRSINVGNQTQWGVEGEFELRYGSNKLLASYAFTKLINFDLFTKNTWITAQPFGYGDDLADWATHSTKLWYTYYLNKKIILTSTLRAFWGFEGSRDYRDKLVNDKKVFITSGWENAYREQVYLNIGAHYLPLANTVIKVDFYNILGILDKNINKRLIRSLGAYRSEATAVSIGLSVSI